MRSTPALRASTLLLFAWTFPIGCTVSGNGTNGSNTSQCRIDTDVLCPGDFVGYSCQGEAKPSPTCGDGTLESDGEIGYCCGVSDTGTCVVDATAECSDGSTGYSCTSGVTPNATAGSSLVCSTSTPGLDAELLYCCSAG